jgi:hypothetical protein
MTIGIRSEGLSCVRPNRRQHNGAAEAPGQLGESLPLHMGPPYPSGAKLAVIV